MTTTNLPPSSSKSKNRYFTIMIIPEKTSQVRKLVVPSWIVKGAGALLALATVLTIVMLFDYGFVMSQIGENRDLRTENRKLRQQVQVFKSRIDTIESTMDRIKTFATRLKVITNIEDRGGLLQSLNRTLPDAATNIGNTAQTTDPRSAPSPALQAQKLAANGAPDERTAEDIQLEQDFLELDRSLTLLNQSGGYLEQLLQDQYELLADQKAFLAALPTRRPVTGYFTNGFGVRKSPYGGRVKMHEGLDIANRPGTPIRAPADGVVVYSATKAGYGQTLIIDHGYGLETWYGHNRKLLVKTGQKVKRGEMIAQLGNSGRSTGPHLHYEVRVNGTPVDPLSYILEN